MNILGMWLRVIQSSASVLLVVGFFFGTEDVGTAFLNCNERTCYTASHTRKLVHFKNFNINFPVLHVSFIIALFSFKQKRKELWVNARRYII
jgi:hypothetical protein